MEQAEMANQPRQSVAVNVANIDETICRISHKLDGIERILSGDPGAKGQDAGAPQPATVVAADLQCAVMKIETIDTRIAQISEVLGA